MTNCQEISDRMPAVAAGPGAWSAEEVAHLASCADCQAEWRLVGAARRLGAPGSSVDPVAMAARVQERLRAEPAARVISFPSRRGGWLLGLAAAAAIVLAVTVPKGTRSGPAPAAVAIGGTLPELDDLSAAELEAVLKELEGPPAADVTEPSGMSDLNAGELERVLRSWEG